MKNTFSISQAVSFGWNTFKTNWKFWLVVFFLVFGASSSGTGGSNSSRDETLTPAVDKVSAIINADSSVSPNVLGVQTPTSTLNTSNPYITNAETLSKLKPLLIVAVPYLIVMLIGFVFLFVLSLAVSTILQMGFMHLCIDAARGNTLEYKTLLSDVSVKKALRLIGLSLIVFVLVLLGLLFFIIPGIYLALKYMFATQLFIDKNLSIGQALKQSGVLTKGVKLKLFGSIIVIMLVALVGLIAFIVGLVPAIIVIQLAVAFIYVTLDKQNSEVIENTGAVV